MWWVQEIRKTKVKIYTKQANYVIEITKTSKTNIFDFVLSKVGMK